MINNQPILNWFDNPNDCLILLDRETSNKLALRLKNRYVFNKNIKDEFDDCKFLYRLKYNKPIKIRTLKKILARISLNFYNYNRCINSIGSRNFMLNTDFPIKLNKTESAILVAAFMSDGNNQDQHPFYANIGFLGNKILKIVQHYVPNIPWEIRNEKIRFHPILSRILLKLEVPIGNKTIINPKIPNFIYQNKKYMKAYLTQVFDDEGYAPTRTSRKMVLGRSVALKDLPRNFISTLIYNKKIYFNCLPEDIKKIVNKQPPNLLEDEHNLLKEFGIRSALRCRGICKYLDTISADWVIEVYGKENIEKFNKEIGFSHPDKVKQINSYLDSYTVK